MLGILLFQDHVNYLYVSFSINSIPCKYLCNFISFTEI